MKNFSDILAKSLNRSRENHVAFTEVLETVNRIHGIDASTAVAAIADMNSIVVILFTRLAMVEDKSPLTTALNKLACGKLTNAMSQVTGACLAPFNDQVKSELFNLIQIECEKENILLVEAFNGLGG